MNTVTAEPFAMDIFFKKHIQDQLNSVAYLSYFTFALSDVKYKNGVSHNQ